MTIRKQRIRTLADGLATTRDGWIERNSYYHLEDLRYLRFLIPPGSRVLDLGCGNGRTLAALEPSEGVGVDFSPAVVEQARRLHPDLEFHLGDIEDPGVLEDLGGPFDVILLSDTVGSLDDVQSTLARLHALCDQDTRVILSYYNNLWSPLLRVGELIGQKMPTVEQNWLSRRDLEAILTLAEFDIVRSENRQIFPKRAGGFGNFANKYLGTLPGVRTLGLRSYVIARSPVRVQEHQPSVSIVVPCRNEAGNIEAALERTPAFCADMEFVFVEGHSTDGTWEAIQQAIAKHPELDIVALQQPGKGKGDAVRAAFDVARGDVLMILDADLTTPPDDLPKFYEVIASGRGELVMGSRLVYPMEEDAMRLLNTAGNRAFSLLFTWMLHQRITDTLCGTKVLTRRSYEKIKAGRSYFGEFDPFGDFDLIFGAAKANLQIVEVPVRYGARTYGSTQISRFRHGLLLLRMTAVAYRRLTAI